MKWLPFMKKPTIFNLSIEKFGKFTAIKLKNTLESLPKNGNHLIFFSVSLHLKLHDALCISGALSEYKEKKGSHPIYTFGEDSVCGPNLLVFLSGSKSIAHEATIFGFYDFMYEGNNYSALKSYHNVDIEFITSGINKLRLNPIEDTKPDDFEWMKKILQTNKTIMINKIAQLRPSINVDGLNKTLGSRIISAQEMKSLGLIDEFGTKEAKRFQDFPNHKLNYSKNRMLKPLTFANSLLKLQDEKFVQNEIKSEIKVMLNGMSVVEYAASLNSPMLKIEI